MQGGSASPEDIVSKLEALRKRVPAVSYTHLTLPTTERV